jgi:hypothetical protein
VDESLVKLGGEDAWGGCANAADWEYLQPWKYHSLGVFHAPSECFPAVVVALAPVHLAMEALLDSHVSLLDLYSYHSDFHHHCSELAVVVDNYLQKI